MAAFVGASLRLARLFHDLSLAELGERASVSKQFLSRVENGSEPVSSALARKLAEELEVLPSFFHHVDAEPIADEQCHFRSNLTTKLALRQVARARGEMLKKLLDIVDKHVQLPRFAIEAADPDDAESIERAAERFRGSLGLGVGPLSNVLRVAENAGAVVMKVRGLTPDIDAVSFATRRPLIAVNDDGRSACRRRFGIAHELGHFALHPGVLTGDRLTETQANRFASALLMPRHAFAMECRAAIRGTRLNWQALSALKMRWRVSKAAIIYRGRQLGVFSEAHARAGYIGLNRHGEAVQESEDHLIAQEEPEVITDSLTLMRERLGIPLAAIARQMMVSPDLLNGLLRDPQSDVMGNNVVTLLSATKPA